VPVLDDQIANLLVAEILYLAADDPEKDIFGSRDDPLRRRAGEARGAAELARDCRPRPSRVLDDPDW